MILKAFDLHASSIPTESAVDTDYDVIFVLTLVILFYYRPINCIPKHKYASTKRRE